MHELVWPSVVVAIVAFVLRSVLFASRFVDDGALVGHLKKLLLAQNVDRAGKLLEAADRTILGGSLRALFLRSRQDGEVEAWRRAFDETFARRARPLVVTAPIVIVLFLLACAMVLGDAVDREKLDPAPLVALGVTLLVFSTSTIRAEVRMFRRAKKNRDAFVHALQSA